MADPNKIRLNPIDFNDVVVTGNAVNLECDPFVPSGWTPPPGVTPVGGSDTKPTLTDPQSTTG
jgi:hypothetical protein